MPTIGTRIFISANVDEDSSKIVAYDQVKDLSGIVSVLENADEISEALMISMTINDKNSKPSYILNTGDINDSDMAYNAGLRDDDFILCEYLYL